MGSLRNVREQGKSGGIWKLRQAYSPETHNLGQNRWCFVPCDLEIWWMTLENNRASLLRCFKLCATFHSHWWIHSNWNYSPETANLGQIRRILEPCNLDGWPCKTIRHLFYATSCFLHHFVPIGVFKLELQPGNAQFGSKSTIFFSCVTFKLDRWPWKKHLFYATSSFVHHFVPIGEFKLELQSRNAQFGSNSTILKSRATLKFDGWPWKTIGHLLYKTLSFVPLFQCHR